MIESVEVRGSLTVRARVELLLPEPTNMHVLLPWLSRRTVRGSSLARVVARTSGVFRAARGASRASASPLLALLALALRLAPACTAAPDPAPRWLQHLGLDPPAAALYALQLGEDGFDSLDMLPLLTRSTVGAAISGGSASSGNSDAI